MTAELQGIKPLVMAAHQGTAGARPLRRVLHVYKTYFPDSWGGLEQSIFQICRSTALLGVENHIFTLSRTSEQTKIQRPEALVSRYPITFELASCPISLAGAKAFRKMLQDVDLVHYHFPWPFADVLDELRPATVPSIVTYHSDIVRQRRLLRFYRPLMFRFLARANQIVATSRNYLSTSTDLGVFADQVQVIPLGLDEATYPSVCQTRVARWQSRLGKGFFLFIGVLRYYKGLEFLLEAARNATFKIVIVGSGPTEAWLRALAQEKQLTNVEFLGFVDDADKLALLELCRAVVFPSHLRAEAFGVSLLEAAMRGKPMISSEIGTGTSYVNVDNDTGIVVPAEDPVALRQAMEALDQHDDMAQRMGRAARRRFEQLFAAKRMGEQYRDLYERILQKVGVESDSRRQLNATR